MKKCLLVCVLLVICGCNKNLKTERKMSDLSENLVAHYKMDDNADSTVVLDSSGNNNHGTSARNTSLMHAAGKVGDALSFNGESDYVEIGAIGTTFNAAFSLNLWFKTLDGKPETDVFSCLLGNSPRSYLSVSEGFRVDIDGYGITAVYAINVAESEQVVLDRWDGRYDYLSDGENDWKMITVIVEPTIVDGQTRCKIILYLDGVYVATAVSGCYLNMLNSSIPNFCIGSALSDNSEPIDYFTGSLDDIRIYNKALSASEVRQLYREVVPNNNRGTVFTSDNNSIYGTDSNSIFGE